MSTRNIKLKDRVLMSLIDLGLFVFDYIESIKKIYSNTLNFKVSKVIKALILLLYIIGLKFLFSQSNINDLQLLISPIAKIVSIITLKDFLWISDQGFFNSQLNILINKGCSGGYFYIILSSMIIGKLLFSKISNRQKTLYSIKGIILTYVLVVLVNSSRIIGAILLSKIPFLAELLSSDLGHQIFGGIIYFFVLFAIYQFLSKIIK